MLKLKEYRECMKNIENKYSFEVFCNKHDINKSNPLYETFKDCYDIGTRYGSYSANAEFICNTDWDLIKSYNELKDYYEDD
jgi:hypothetical protein